MNPLPMLQKYLTLILAGVHAANTVPLATNADKKEVVVATVLEVGAAVAAATGDPQVIAVEQLIAMTVGPAVDVVASVVNRLHKKTAEQAAPVRGPVPAGATPISNEMQPFSLGMGGR